MRRLSLAHRFMLASFVILVFGMIIIGWWVGQQIEAGVINRTAATTALYVDSFVAPHLQELGQAEPLTNEHMAVLSRLLEDTPLGQHIIAFKVWDSQGRILYSTSPSSTGLMFPVRGRLARAFQGEVASQISDLGDEENASERERWKRLLETYSPVRLEGTNRVIAVAEFYQTVEDLEEEIFSAQVRSWLLVGGATLVMYLLLAGIVRRGSNIIARQEVSLRNQVSRLTEILEQNKELHERVRLAATRTTELNERFLHRISAELHDGPAQGLSLALLRMDNVIAYHAESPSLSPKGFMAKEDLMTIETSLRHALQEVRSIAAGLRLPELRELTLLETLERVVHTHERRSSTKVTLTFNHLPEQAPLPVKIAIYRLIQEALTNAYRHGGGVGQQVQVGYENGHLSVEVSDRGPGFDWTQVAGRDDQLGLLGMRERVESLGGVFQIASQAGIGTQVIARLPLHSNEEIHE